MPLSDAFAKRTFRNFSDFDNSKGGWLGVVGVMGAATGAAVESAIILFSAKDNHFDLRYRQYIALFAIFGEIWDFQPQIALNQRIPGRYPKFMKSSCP